MMDIITMSTTTSIPRHMLHADGTMHSILMGKGSLWMGMLHRRGGHSGFCRRSAGCGFADLPCGISVHLVFSIGVLVAMALYAGALGGLIRLGGRRFRAVMIGAQALTGILACVVGYCWVSGIEIPWIHLH
jgi:hypothetical protein